MANRISCTVLAMALLPGIVTSVPAADATDAPASPLERYLKPLIDGHQGDVAIAAKHLKTGATYSHQAEMNRTAKALGMTNSTYQNTHGLTEEGHVASCHDLVKLAHAGLQNEHFRKVVRTREYGTKVVGTSGYERNLHWKTTDLLLPIEGYDGVKTGTTEAAGGCLVSSCRRDEDHLIIVVLGASSSDSRYSDSRNLYRWAWKQR